MSASAVLLGVLQELREGEHALDNPPLTVANSAIQPGGFPPPLSPDTYISIDGGESSNPADPAQDHIKERYAVSVWISRRTGKLERNSTYIEERKGLERIERQIKRALHGQVSILAAMNGYLDEGVQPFLEMLWWVRSGKPEPKSNDWSSESVDPNNASAWLVQRIDFVGALRVQNALAIW